MATALSLEQFWHSPARQLLAYPSGDEDTLISRWVELQSLQLDAIYSHGPQTLATLNILGAGYCGVVLQVQHQGRPRGLKIRRQSASRATLHREADMLKRANTVRVGPQYIAHSANLLLMDYVQGPMLVDWLQTPRPAKAIYGVTAQLIHQAYRLDQAGLDHGSLRCITAHGLVAANAPVLIDFSDASVDRRPANVTTLVQGLFVSTQITQLLQPWFPQVIKSELVEYLRRYKHDPSWRSVQSLLTYLQLE